MRFTVDGMEPLVDQLRIWSLEMINLKNGHFKFKFKVWTKSLKNGGKNIHLKK